MKMSDFASKNTAMALLIDIFQGYIDEYISRFF